MNLIFCIINGKNLFWCDIKILIHWSICFGFYLFYSKKIYFNPLVLPQACRMNNMVFMSYICFFCTFHECWRVEIKAPWLLIHSTKKEKRRILPLLHFADRCHIFSENKRIEIVFFGYN